MIIDLLKQSNWGLKKKKKETDMVLLLLEVKPSHLADIYRFDFYENKLGV